jgi:hypothetical protein
MVHFRSPAREMLQRWGIAWHYQSQRGTLIAQDDADYWTLQTRPKPGDDLDRVEPAALLARFMGPVGLRNRQASGRHTEVRLAIAQAYREAGDSLEVASPETDARRAALTARIAARECRE